MKNKLLSGVLLAAALVLMGVGVWRGEALEVLNKGIHLCLECVGIG